MATVKYGKPVTYSLEKLFDLGFQVKFKYFSPYVRNFIGFLKDEGFSKVEKKLTEVGLADDTVTISNGIMEHITHAAESLLSLKFNSKYSTNLEPGELCFSSDPWDIATMSMRGIRSCMSWGSLSDSSSSLAGSILDPNCAVIYIRYKNFASDGEGMIGEFGSQMLARSVVRVAFDVTTKAKVILLEGAYTNPSRGRYISSRAEQIFTKYLRTKTGLRVTKKSAGLLLPYFKDMDRIPHNYLSYRDSKVQYNNV